MLKYKLFLFIFLLPLYLNAQYKIIIASVSNKSSLDVITKDVKKILKAKNINYNLNFNNTKAKYTRISIYDIPNFKEAKRVKKIISHKYKDSYIRQYKKNKQIKSQKLRTKKIEINKVPEVVILKKKSQEKKALTIKDFSKVDYSNYIRALNAYKINDFLTSYEILNKLHPTYSNNNELNYFLGRSAFELKKYKESYDAFNRIVVENKLTLRVRLEKAKSLYFLKSYDMALIELNTILQYPISLKVRKSVENFIEVIKLKQKS